MKQRNLFSKVTSVVLLLVILLAVSLTSNLQEKQENNPRIITEVTKNLLIELFINAECSTCPKAAFCLEELAWGYEPGKVILLEMHIWGDGYDTPETNARYNWYVGNGKKGTPDTFFNGMSERIQGLCCDCGDIDENFAGYQEIIENHLETATPIKINAEQNICSGKVIIQGELSNIGNLMLQDLFISGAVYYEGDESKFFYLVKDIFEKQDICQLSPKEKRGFSFISELDLSALEDEELEKYKIVIFVQDKLSKVILQSILLQ